MNRHHSTPHRFRPRDRRGLVLASALLIGLPGCAGPRGAGRPGPDAIGSLAPGVDPAKAYLPLSRIEPAPSAPTRPEGIPPLSARSVDEIQKADALIQEQRYTEAAIELQKALRYDPQHPDIHRTLALLHWEAGNVERARAHATKTLELNSDDAAAQYVLGRCLLSAGDRPGAMAAFRTAMLCSDFERAAKVSSLCHYHLAETLAAEGFLEAALAEYEAFEKSAASTAAAAGSAELRTLSRGQTSATADARARLLETLGRYGPAADALAPMAAERREDSAVSLRYAGLLARAGRLEEARHVAERIPPDQPGVFELLRDIHQRSGQPERVIDDLRRMIAAQPDRFQLVLSLADALIGFQRPEEAEKEIRSALAANPTNTALRQKLIELLAARSDWRAALAVAAEGIEQTPAESAAYETRVMALAVEPTAVEQLLSGDGASSYSEAYLCGVLARAAGREEAAEKLLRQSHTAQPDFVPARVGLGRLYLRQYRYEEALRAAARRQDGVAEDARLEMILGQVHQRLDEVNSAELHFKAALQLDRSDLEAMYALSELYRRSGQILRAQRQLRVLLEQDPGHERAMELLATTYLDEHKRDVALEQFETLGRVTRDPRTRARCEALLAQARKPDPDVEAYRGELLAAIDQHGPDPLLWLAIAESYGDDDGAKRSEAYQQVLTLDPDSEEAAAGLAELSVRLLDFEQAVERFRGLLRRRPNRFPWMLATNERSVPGLIELYRLTRQYDEALELARSAETRAAKDDAWRRRFRLAIVETLRVAGRTEEAIASVKAWVEQDPEDRAWSATLAVEYERQDRPAEAAGVWIDLHRKHPGDRETLRDLVRALMSAKRYERASQYVLDWLADDPDNEVALRWLVAVLADAERFDDGIELVRARLLNTLAREEFQRLEIQLLTRAKRHRESLDVIDLLLDEVNEVLRRVVQGRDAPAENELPPERLARMPNEPFNIERLQDHLHELRLVRAGVLTDAGEYRQAEDDLQRRLEEAASPEERISYLFQFAQLRRAQGDEVGATEQLSRALALRPSDVRLNNDVAYGWIDQGVRLVEAERMIRFALARAPRQAAYLDTLGWLLYKKGDFEEAEKWLARAHGTGINDPVVLDHLGDTCWRLGRKDEAGKYWEAAVAAEKKRQPDRPISGDERRVRDETPRKLDDSRAGREPTTAPLAATP